MVCNAKGTLISNTKLHWKELFYISKIEKYKPVHLLSFDTNLMNISVEANT